MVPYATGNNDRVVYMIVHDWYTQGGFASLDDSPAERQLLGIYLQLESVVL